MIDKNKRTTFLLSFERENQIHFQCYKLCNNYSEVLSIDITQDSVFVVMEDGGDGGGLSHLNHKTINKEKPHCLGSNVNVINM